MLAVLFVDVSPDLLSIACNRACLGSTCPGRLVALPKALPSPVGKTSLVAWSEEDDTVGCCCCVPRFCCCCKEEIPEKTPKPPPAEALSSSSFHVLVPLASFELTQPSLEAKLERTVSSHWLHREELICKWSKCPCLYWEERGSFDLKQWVSPQLGMNKQERNSKQQRRTCLNIQHQLTGDKKAESRQ